MSDHYCFAPTPGAERLIRNRHLRDCEASDCQGCQPCPERMCQVCTREHVTIDGRGTDQTCATCLGTVRDQIKAVHVMATALLGEALRRGLNSNAAALAGPIADPETWGYRRMSAIAARIDPKWLDEQVDMLHPSWVLGTWERESRVHLEQELPPRSAPPTLTEAWGYLDGQLTALAHDPEFPFEELAGDVQVCHTHVERVLCLDDYVETGAPCPSCGRANLVKDFAETEDDDRWTCPRCKQWWSEADYRTKVAGTYVAVSPILTASQIAVQYRVPEGTVRRWASGDSPSVRTRGKDDQGRQLYDVADVLTQRDRRTTA